MRLGEHRGELQGSNAIHDILKERIAYLSGKVHPVKYITIILAMESAIVRPQRL